MKIHKTKKTIEYAKQIAKQYGGECLTTEYTNNKIPLTWRCAAGHIFSKSLNTVSHAHQWCPVCFRSMRFNSIDDAQQIAIQHGGKCLSTELKNNKSKLEWECKEGHRWMAQLANVKHHSWCPICARKDTSTALTKWTPGYIQQSFPQYTFLEPFNLHINTPTQIRCPEGHTWTTEPRVLLQGSGCPICAKNEDRFTLSVAQKIADAHSGKCLSEIYTNSLTPLLWECEYGHQWKARLAGVKNCHSWCPICALKKSGTHNRYTIHVKHWKTGNTVSVSGGYELAVIHYLNINQTMYEWHPMIFNNPHHDGSWKYYVPDCYLPNEDLWIEIKGHFYRQEAKVKWEWFHTNFPNSELWTKTTLVTKNIIPKKPKEYQNFISNLREMYDKNTNIHQ